jgi:hypothetical protein
MRVGQRDRDGGCSSQDFLIQEYGLSCTEFFCGRGTPTAL